MMPLHGGSVPKNLQLLRKTQELSWHAGRGSLPLDKTSGTVPPRRFVGYSRTVCKCRPYSADCINKLIWQLDSQGKLNSLRVSYAHTYIQRHYQHMSANRAACLRKEAACARVRHYVIVSLDVNASLRSAWRDKSCNVTLSNLEWLALKEFGTEVNGRGLIWQKNL